MKANRKNIIITILSVAVVVLTVLLVVVAFHFKEIKANDADIMNSFSNIQNELSQKNDEISEQNSIHESEKEELNRKISDLNRQVSLKRKQQAESAAAALPNPSPGSGGKTIYLTFDDGPSPNTPRIISILNSYGIKATFFVKNTSYNGYMKDIVDNGNVIALHSYTHDYKRIYSSDEAFYQDLQDISDLVYLQTGVRSNIMRFPGGGSNTVSKKYSPGIMTRLTQGVADRGYIYYDWNCSSGDAIKNTVPKDTIVANCKRVPAAKNVIVLLHDTDAKGTTVEALPEIIEYYQSCGYTFSTITADTPPVHHKVNN
jgi:peptidoglycan/xylan/chitin deacetylase (PgdA/CDA1 family)